MTDEEKKAIEFIKSELQDEKKTRNDYQSLTGLYGNLEIEIILNLIEKQSKEIEELNKSDASKEQSSMKYYNLYKELVDKIKAKIEEYKEKCKNCNFKGKICEDFNKNYNCVIAVCLKEFYSLLEKE